MKFIDWVLGKPTVTEVNTTTDKLIIIRDGQIKTVTPDNLGITATGIPGETGTGGTPLKILALTGEYISFSVSDNGDGTYTITPEVVA